MFVDLSIISWSLDLVGCPTMSSPSHSVGFPTAVGAGSPFTNCAAVEFILLVEKIKHCCQNSTLLLLLREKESLDAFRLSRWASTRSCVSFTCCHSGFASSSVFYLLDLGGFHCNHDKNKERVYLSDFATKK